MKIQFIICGWHMDQDSLIDGLKSLQKPMSYDKINGVEIDAFWSCHRTPPDRIKDNFDCKEFYNGEEECGAYQQAIDYLDLDDDTYCFFMHDDLVINDWEFVQVCINDIHEKPPYPIKIIGNGANYLIENYDYNKVIDVGIKEEFDGMRVVDYVKPENQHLFDKVLKIEAISFGLFTQEP